MCGDTAHHRRRSRNGTWWHRNLARCALVLVVLATTFVVIGNRFGLTGLTTTPPPASNGPPGPWHLVFDDEFNATALDTTKWSVCYPWGACNNTGNNELEWYQAQNISDSGGVLNLTAMSQGAHGYPYTSALIQTDIPGGLGPSLAALSDTHQARALAETVGPPHPNWPTG